MLSNSKALLLLVGLVLLLSTCFSQTGVLTPEQIDPYSFDPTAIAKTATYNAQATKAYTDGNYEDAARFYLAHLQSKPDDSTAWYNLSCCYGLLGRAELAAKYLKLAYQAGYTDLEHIAQDTDFTQVRETAEFTSAMDSLGVWSERRAYYEGDTRWLSTRNLMPYHLLLPKDYDPQKSYTLLIGLHGYGDVAKNFSHLWRYLDKDELIYVVPEAPYPFTEGNIGFSWNPPLDYETPEMAAAVELLEQYILDVREDIALDYKIGSTWLLGFSQGAYMGYLLTIRNPWLYEGLIACGGGLVGDMITDEQFEAAKELKVVISHGKQDQVVPFDEATTAKDILSKYDFKNVYLDEFDGAHRVSPTAFGYFRKWRSK